MNTFFTIINNGYINFAINFYNRWEKLEIQNNLIFICTDNECYNYMLSKGIANCILFNSNILNSSVNLEIWGTQEYQNIVFNKLNITQKFIQQKSLSSPFITYIDTDIWLNYNFTKELDKILENNLDYDIIFQDGEDYLHNTDECCYLSIDYKLHKIRKCNDYCTGFMSFNCIRSSSYNNIMNLLSFNMNDMKSFQGNQAFINSKLDMSNLNIGNIPKTIFPNFSTCFHYKNLSNYWMLHYTYLKGKEKIYYMKKNGHWCV